MRSRNDFDKRFNTLWRLSTALIVIVFAVMLSVWIGLGWIAFTTDWSNAAHSLGSVVGQFRDGMEGRP